MSSTNAIFELTAQPRDVHGKGASRRLRRMGLVPGILYGAHKEAMSVHFSEHDVRKALSHEAFYSHILTIHVNGKPEKAVLKALQRHPYKPRILHMDFMRISATEKITMQIPIHFTGEEAAPGVKDHGGIISHHMIHAEISCLPADLPEFVSVDVSTLDIDGVIHLSEIQLPKGVAFTALAHDNDQLVVSIHLPRIEEEPVVAEEETAEAAAAAEGEAAPAEGEAKPADEATSSKDKKDKSE